jgi:hypothetical protein
MSVADEEGHPTVQRGLSCSQRIDNFFETRETGFLCFSIIRLPEQHLHLL